MSSLRMVWTTGGLSLLAVLQISTAFLPSNVVLPSVRSIATTSKQQPLFSTTDEEKKIESKEDVADAHAVNGAATNSSSNNNNDKKNKEDVEGLPWWWELVWKLDVMKKGEQGQPIIFGDSANVLRTNIEQIYGGYESLDKCPLAGTKTRVTIISFAVQAGID